LPPLLTNHEPDRQKTLIHTLLGALVVAAVGGLAVMVFVSVLPVGFLQLEAAFTQTYGAARSLAFYDQSVVQWLFWARLPGDTMIIIGTIIFLYDMVVKRFTLRPVSEPTDAPARGTIPERVMSDDDD
jgi:nitric oxide reductase subunit B